MHLAKKLSEAKVPVPVQVLRVTLGHFTTHLLFLAHLFVVKFSVRCMDCHTVF